MAEVWHLGPEGGDAYVSANPTGGQIAFRMTPERRLTVDYSKVYGETADDASL